MKDMVKRDLRFGQLISNLESMGINFHDEFYTENKRLMEKIKNIRIEAEKKYFSDYL